VAGHVFREGRLLLEAARKSRRIVQHGTQMRSGPVTEEARANLFWGASDSLLTRCRRSRSDVHAQPNRAWSAALLSGATRPLPGSEYGNGRVAPLDSTALQALISGRLIADILSRTNSPCRGGWQDPEQQAGPIDAHEGVPGALRLAENDLSSAQCPSGL